MKATKKAGMPVIAPNLFSAPTMGSAKMSTSTVPKNMRVKARILMARCCFSGGRLAMSSGISSSSSSSSSSFIWEPSRGSPTEPLKPAAAAVTLVEERR